MVILYFIMTVIAVAVALYYRSKAKEFESLFELSKGYGGWPDEVMPMLQPAEYDMRYKDWTNKALAGTMGIKLNKDGSIAKKRGRKPSHE